MFFDALWSSQRTFRPLPCGFGRVIGPRAQDGAGCLWWTVEGPFEQHLWCCSSLGLAQSRGPLGPPSQTLPLRPHRLTRRPRPPPRPARRRRLLRQPLPPASRVAPLLRRRRPRRRPPRRPPPPPVPPARRRTSSSS